MKLVSFNASDVHGYLKINIDFFEELTFLTGLNGSGKTSALRILMALLTPKIEDLGAISFSSAQATIIENEKKIRVTAQRTSDGIELSVTTAQEPLTLTNAEIDLLREAKQRDEPRSLVHEKFQASSVYQALRELSTPMFLGIDRRFSSFSNALVEPTDARRREYLARRYWPDESAGRSPSTIADLIDVNFLVVRKMQEVRAAQEILDEKLREKFFTKAFEYKPGNIVGSVIRAPSKQELSKYREKLKTIDRAIDGSSIPVPKIRAALSEFFSKMSGVIDSLNQQDLKPLSKRKSKTNTKSQKPAAIDSNLVDWIINKPQSDRIFEHLHILEEYIVQRDALRDPVTRFIMLVNKFYAQTNKKVTVADSGQLAVSAPDWPDSRPISALSSGERQLLVMLAHLSLNPSLFGSGVFIVDEPELSLHIDWQEKFVDAIREANPNVQLILATHSPAIILDRVDSCRSIS